MIVEDHPRSRTQFISFQPHDQVPVPQKLDKVYRKDSQFCVMFISDAYAKKMWTNLERRSVQARVLGDRSDYLLPVCFDDTEIEGLHPTVAYIDLHTRTPEDFALLVIDKVRLRI